MPHYTAPRTLSRKIEDYLDYGFTSNATTSASAASTAYDAFGRMRVSEPLTLFDSSHRYGDNGLWATLTATSGAAVHNVNQGLVDLNVTAASGSSVIRETTKVMSYQPGKSLLVMNTFVMNAAKTGLRQRVGYFGVANGMYLQLDGSVLSLIERTSVSGSLVENPVLQSAWNADKLDGTGPSGIVLDITKAHILWMDIEWLGVGSVRMGFVINGKFIVAHTFHHANSIASTYITSASLPLRYEITNTAATTGVSTLKQICSTVLSEGGYELRGTQQAVSFAPTTPYALIAATDTDYPVITMRLRSARPDAVAILSALSLIPTTAGNFRWKIIARGTTSGGTGTWVDVDAASAIQYKLDATAITGGRTVASGYVTQTNQSNTSINIPKDELFQFQFERDSLNSVYYEITLVVAAGTATSGSKAAVLASIDWEEVSR